ncbi:MAG: universal stress protein [Myxococcaceae bacterium]
MATFRGMDPFKHILVPTDFGDAADRAIEVASELAKRFDAQLTIAHVFQAPAQAYAGMEVGAEDYLPRLRRVVQGALDDVLEAAQSRLPRAKTVLVEGRPWERILSIAQDLGVDLVVMGTHGRKGLPHAVMGSVAEKVVRYSPVPVLTVRVAKPKEPEKK